jgi:hypothetical protein
MEDPGNLAETFASLDRARLSRMDERVRTGQLDARQAFQDYVEGLWQDVQRSGERPDVGEKYQALAVVRELARTLTSVAFDAVYGQSP